MHESFDDSIRKNSANDNPFDINININMTRLNNLFKIAEYLQIKRLLTIIGARHASLMTNMDKNKMIQWLVDNNLARKQRTVTIDSNGKCNSNKECANSENDDTINVNKINEYSWVLLGNIVPFFSCCDIRTFSSFLMYL